MIQILLLILKIIGIILLAVFGILLLILALVLFVPVSYRAQITHHPDQTRVTASVSFLFPLFVFKVQYLNGISYKLRLLGIVLLNSERPKKTKNKKQQEQKPEKQEKPKKEKMQGTAEKEPPERAGKQQQEKKSPEQETKEQESTGRFEKIRSKIQKTRKTISTVIAKIKTVLHKKDRLVQLFEMPETKQALSFAYQKLKHLLKHIFPKKINGFVVYGADEPATTGQVLGVLSVLYAKTGSLLEIQPDFNNKRLECEVELRGRIQLFTLLCITLKVFFNKELRLFLEKLKKIKEIE